MAEPATLQLCLVLSLVVVFFSLLAFGFVIISKGLPVPLRRGHQPRTIDLTGHHIGVGTRPYSDPGPEPPHQGSAGSKPKSPSTRLVTEGAKPGKSPSGTRQIKHRPF